MAKRKRSSTRKRRTASPLSILREELGLTVNEAAERAGVSRGHLLNLQAGRHNPTADTIQKIARGWRVPMTRVFNALRDSRGFPCASQNRT